MSKRVKEPFEFSFSMVNLKNGFSKCGIFPFNRTAVSDKMAPSSVYQKNLDTPSKDQVEAAHSSTDELAPEENAALSITSEPSSQCNTTIPIASTLYAQVSNMQSSQESNNSSNFYSATLQ